MEKELLEYFDNDVLAAEVWSNKYKAEGEVTPDDTHRRLAKEFARVEKDWWNNKEPTELPDNLSDYAYRRNELDESAIYELFKDFKYIVPQGRVMASLGVLESYRSLSNCLRLPPPKDSYSSIMYSDTMLVSAAKRGCGYGLGLSNIRPKGTLVKNAARHSSGTVSFMSRYSNSTREVSQSGRRGACLVDLDINHPDSLEFINSKIDRTMITGANISVKTWDAFFEAVENDEDYILRFPCDMELNPHEVRHMEREGLEYDTLYPLTMERGYIKKIKAKEYFDAIVHNAWENAEPGLFFWDKVINYDPSSVYSKYFIDGMNACGEQPMPVFSTCRLILLNLFSYVKNPFTKEAEIDFDLLYKMAYEQMRLGDDLVDLEIEYIDRILGKIESDDLPDEEKAIEKTLWEKVKDMAMSGRRVGCGITALGDMIAALGLKYDSEEALAIVDKVMAKKMGAELDCNIDLAILRGTFEGWDKNKEYESYKLEDDFAILGKNQFYTSILENFPEKAYRMYKHGRRSVNWNTIAPGGSMSIMTQTTSSGEPIFMPYYMRRKKINPDEEGVRVDFKDQSGDTWQEFAVVHPKFKEWMIVNIKPGATHTEEAFSKLTKEDLQKAFEISPWYKSTANDIDWVKRVEMQSILQKYTTSAISSTINLPNDVSEGEVAEIYMEAWKQGLKGVTVYRDGSRSGVLVSENATEEDKFESKNAPKRPKVLEADVHNITALGEQFTVIVGLFNSKPYEVFVSKGSLKKGRTTLTKLTKGRYKLDEEVLELDASDAEIALTRMISTSLRHRTNIKFIVEQLNKADGLVASFSKAVARTLKKYIPDGEKSKTLCQNPDCTGDRTNVVFQEGCLRCNDCGSSACG